MLQNAMGVLSQPERCSFPGTLEKDRLEEVSRPKRHQSPPEKEGSLSSNEGDTLSSTSGPSPGGNSCDSVEDDEASSTESAQNGVSESGGLKAFLHLKLKRVLAHFVICAERKVDMGSL